RGAVDARRGKLGLDGLAHHAHAGTGFGQRIARADVTWFPRAPEPIARSFLKRDTTMSIETISEQRCFGGVQGFYKHASTETGGTMKLGVFRPPQAATGNLPVLYYP